MTTATKTEKRAISDLLVKLAADNPLISSDQLLTRIKEEWKKRGLEKTFGRISSCSVCLRFKLSLGQEKKEILVPIN